MPDSPKSTRTGFSSRLPASSAAPLFTIYCDMNIMGKSDGMTLAPQISIPLRTASAAASEWISSIAETAAESRAAANEKK